MARGRSGSRSGAGPAGTSPAARLSGPELQVYDRAQLAAAPLPKIPGVHLRSDGVVAYEEDGKTWVLHGIRRGMEAIGDCDYRFHCESDSAQACTYSEETGKLGGVSIYRYPVNQVRVLHCTLGPAHWTNNGRREWYRWGELHRNDGPAVEHDDGSFEWHQHGRLHRDGDEPAQVSPVGRFWYADGVPHRLGAPAVIYNSGAQEWWEFGDRHREDGPAVEGADGSKQWFHRGVHHRDDGPAVEMAGGKRIWYQHGDRHNAEGPALIEPDGTKGFYLEGEEVSYGIWLSRTGRMPRATGAGAPGSVSAAMNRR